MPTARGQLMLELLLAAAVGTLLLLVSDLLVSPATTPFPGHGERYAAMVAQPFAGTGAFPHRVLWPLLAHAAGWFGITPVGFTAVTSAGLLAVVFWFARRRTSPANALLLTAAVATTGAVQVYKPMACMSADTLDLILMLLAVHHVRRPGVHWGLIALATFSHEMVLFFAPWLLAMRLQAGGTLRREVVAVIACAAVHGIWRTAIGMLGDTAYDASYYAGNAFWVPWGMPSMCALFVLVVLAEFGPLLAIAVRGWWCGDHGLGGRAGPWLFLACNLSLLVFAYDVMRFATLLVLPVILGGLALAQLRRGPLLLLLLTVASVGTYGWDHPVPSQQGGATFTTVSGDVLRLFPPDVIARIVAKERITAADGARHFAALLLERPWLWAGVAAAALAVIALGLGLARLGRSPRQP